MSWYVCALDEHFFVAFFFVFVVTVVRSTWAASFIPASFAFLDCLAFVASSTILCMYVGLQ